MKPAGAVLAFLGAAVAVLGIYLGLASVTRLSTNCGSGFSGVLSSVAAKDQSNADRLDQEQSVGDLTNALEGQPVSQHAPIDRHRLADACQAAVSDRRTLALVVTVPGGALFIAGLVLLAWPQRREVEA